MNPSPLTGLLLAFGLVSAAAPRTPGTPGTGTAGPTLAVEDTMHTSVPEILVRAPRVTLDEILDRVARGEQRRDSLMLDQTYLATVRLVKNDGKGGDLIAESVRRMYKKRPDLARSLTLRHWEKKPDKKKDDDQPVSVSFRDDMSEEVVNFAFRPEARRAYRYKITARDLVGNHLIYRIEFVPRSLLDPAVPSGLVWVDTNEFVIVRQEVHFDRSPVPVLLKDIDRMVIERTRVGPYWVLGRVLMRITLTIPVPQVGRSFDVAVRFDDYQINTGLPDSLFAGKPR